MGLGRRGRAQVGRRRLTTEWLHHRAGLHTLLAWFSTFCIAWRNRGRWLVGLSCIDEVLHSRFLFPGGVNGQETVGRKQPAAVAFKHKNVFDKTAAKLVTTNDQNRGFAEAAATTLASGAKLLQTGRVPLP
jgi:hypothetical protein